MRDTAVPNRIRTRFVLAALIAAIVSATSAMAQAQTTSTTSSSTVPPSSVTSTSTTILDPPFPDQTTTTNVVLTSTTTVFDPPLSDPSTTTTVPGATSTTVYDPPFPTTTPVDDPPEDPGATPSTTVASAAASGPAPARIVTTTVVFPFSRAFSEDTTTTMGGTPAESVVLLAPGTTAAPRAPNSAGGQIAAPAGKVGPPQSEEGSSLFWPVVVGFACLALLAAAIRARARSARHGPG